VQLKKDKYKKLKMMEKYTVNLTVEGEKKDIEKFIEHNLVSCSYAQIKNVEIKEEKQISEETNIFGKISGDQYKGLIEGYQTKKGGEFTKWYDNLQNEEKIFLSSMFD